MIHEDWIDPLVLIELTEGYLTPIACAYLNEYRITYDDDDIMISGDIITIKRMLNEIKTIPVCETRNIQIEIKTKPHQNLMLRSIGDFKSSLRTIVPGKDNLRNVLINHTQHKREITEHRLITGPVKVCFKETTDHEIFGTILNSPEQQKYGAYQWDESNRRKHSKLQNAHCLQNMTAREVYNIDVGSQLYVINELGSTIVYDVQEADIHYIQSNVQCGYRLRYPHTLNATIYTTGNVRLNLMEIFGEEEPITASMLKLNGHILEGQVNSTVDIEISYRHCILPIRLVFEGTFRSSGDLIVAHCARNAIITTVSFFADKTLTYTVPTDAKVFGNVVTLENIQSNTTIIASSGSHKCTVTLNLLNSIPNIVYLHIPMSLEILVPDMSIIGTDSLSIHGTGVNLVIGSGTLTRTSELFPDQLERYDSPDASNEYFVATDNGVKVFLKSDLNTSLVLSRLFAVLYKGSVPQQFSFGIVDLNLNLPRKITIYKKHTDVFLIKVECIIENVYHKSHELDIGLYNINVFNGNMYVAYEIDIRLYSEQFSGIMSTVEMPGLVRIGKVYISKPLSLLTGNLTSTFSYNYNNYPELRHLFDFPPVYDGDIEIKDSIRVIDVWYLNVTVIDDRLFVNGYETHYNIKPDLKPGTLITEYKNNNSEVLSIMGDNYHVLNNWYVLVMESTPIIYNVKCTHYSIQKLNIGIPRPIGHGISIQYADIVITDGMLTVMSTKPYVIVGDFGGLLLDIDSNKLEINKYVYDCNYNPITRSGQTDTFSSPYYNVTLNEITTELAYNKLMLSKLKKRLIVNEILNVNETYIHINSNLLLYAKSRVHSVTLSNNTTYRLQNAERHLELFDTFESINTTNAFWGTTSNPGTSTVLTIGLLSYIYVLHGNVLYGKFITQHSIIDTEANDNGDWYYATDILRQSKISESGTYIQLPSLYRCII